MDTFIKKQGQALNFIMKTMCSILIIAFGIGCSPSTVITATWKSPTFSSTKYKNILVAALTANTVVKSSLEYDMASVLAGSVNVLKSIDEFPPEISNSDSDKVAIMHKVKDRNAEAILTISLVSKETQTRYIPGAYPYDPIVERSYYGNFWGYYSYWYPNAYNRGYYVREKIYFIETNLYDVKTERLVWSAQSKTYDPVNLQTFSKEFAALIAAKMKKDGVLNETLPDDRMGSVPKK